MRARWRWANLAALLGTVAAAGSVARACSIGAPTAVAPRVAAALELLDDWQLEEAKAAAEALLAEDHADPSVLLLAAHVQHARGEHLSALSLLQATEDAGGGAAREIEPLIDASARYAAHFETLETDHFKIRYLDKDEILATYAAPVLEAAYQAIGSDLELLPAEHDEKIVVEIYPDARGLAGATGLTIREIETSGTIAVCKFHRLMITSPLATADGYEWADTIAHELAHLVISKKSHNTIPIWLHEGIAKYFETRWRGAAGRELSPYSEKLLADATRRGTFITFQQMHPSMAKLPSQEDAALAFAQVFTIVEYLVGEHGIGSVPALLTLTAQGVRLETAVEKVYGMGLDKIERAWRRYLTRRPFHEVPGAKPRPIRLATSENESANARPLEPMPDRQLHDTVRLAELLQLRGYTQAAIVKYEAAYAKSGTTYATLAYRLARAYADTNRGKEALTVLDRVLAVHPDDNDCHLLAGRLRVGHRDFDGARRHFEAVRLRNPYNPEIHEALRRLYDAQGDAEGAAREARLLELARRPRPTRVYERPPAAPGEALLSLVAIPFGEILLDGRALAAPLWNIPVAAGEHRLERRPAGKSPPTSVHLAPGDVRTVIVR